MSTSFGIVRDHASARVPLQRLHGAQRDTTPAWMTKGLGIGTAMFGESTGELLKPGLTRTDLEKLEKRCAADSAEADPFGEVFCSTASGRAAKEAASIFGGRAGGVSSETCGRDLRAEGSSKAKGITHGGKKPEGRQADKNLRSAEILKKKTKKNKKQKKSKESTTLKRKKKHKKKKTKKKKKKKRSSSSTVSSSTSSDSCSSSSSVEKSPAKQSRTAADDCGTVAPGWF